MKTAVISNSQISYDLKIISSSIAFLLDSLNLKNLIKENDKVVIKPNWIRQSHQHNGDEWESVITHPAVITSVLEFVLGCLKGSGKVTIADGPQTDSSWNEIMSHMTSELWLSMGKKFGSEVEIIDFRDHEWTLKGEIITKRKELTGDPLGPTIVDLSDKSEFADHKIQTKYYGADYNIEETNQAHNAESNKYKVSRTVLESDVFINISKLKTHKKTGITCSLKNLVGINTYKNWLPHYTIGTPDNGGDQFASSTNKSKVETNLVNRVKSVLNKYPAIGKVISPLKGLGKYIFGNTDDVIRSGNWYGNDTIWRTVLDLNKILFYASSDGSIRESVMSNMKRYITIVDGIIAGEGNGPMAPDHVETGLLIAGTNPVAVDCVCAKLMGFDYQKIPMIY